LDVQGFGNTISNGKGTAIFNSPFSLINREANALYVTVRKKGLKEAIETRRDYSQGGRVDWGERKR
jgi:hypothetical protein